MNSCVLNQDSLSTFSRDSGNAPCNAQGKKDEYENPKPITPQSVIHQPAPKLPVRVQQLSNINISHKSHSILTVANSKHYEPSKLDRSLSSLELLGMTLVPLWIAQLNISCAGVILAACAIF